MDWPIVALLLGLLVPITVTVIKFLPPRRGENGTCAKSELYTKVAVLTSKYESFSREVDHLRKDMESLCDKLESVRAAMVELIKRGRV